MAQAGRRGEAQFWKVVGGADKGGILVRAGEALASQAEATRLSRGSVVREVDIIKDRVHYELVTGDGPPRGWVSVRITGKDLLVKCKPPAEDALGLQSASTGDMVPIARPRPAPLGRPAMRVLALHGGGSNRRIMEFQTMQMKKALGDKAEWQFLNGGREWHHHEHPANETMLAMSMGEPFRGWYAVTMDDDSDRPNDDKLFDPSVTVTYDQVEEGVDRVLAHIKDNGPFDVLMGFSQGCIVAHLIAATLRERGEPIPWRLSVLLCGMRVRDSRYLELFDTPLELPCVQVYGKADELYEYGRGSQPQMYTDPVILEHDEGHKFPSAKPRATEIYDRVRLEMLWHCGLSDADPARA